MAIFNYAAREMTAKIVYYGPGLSGKTSSIQYIHTKISPKSKGKLVSLATETDRTLFFDFFPVEFGQIGGFKVKFNFYTVPGQVFYNTTRKLVLKGADGVVFVADSQPGMMEQNLESLENLRENLKAHNIDWDTVPFVLQYNKRDMPGALSVEEMRSRLNPRGVPDFETAATTGMGIMEAMKAICKLVLEDIQQKNKRAGAARPAETKAQPAPAAPTPEAPPAAAPPSAAFGGAPPAPARAEPAPMEEGVTVERVTVVPVSGSGSTALTLSMPVEFQIPAGMEGTELRVQVRIQARAAGQVSLGEVRADRRGEGVEELSPEPPKKKGFFARLFGG
jgi:signal recognition particle receptor subunit beta